MSRHTGKCDFEDWCEMHNSPSEIVEKATIYLGDAKVDIKNEKDLIPYYTHLIASMCCIKDEGQTINLSSHSFIDGEEEEFMTWRIRDVIAAARKAKKEKKPFTFEYFKNWKYYDPFGSTPQFVWEELIKIVNDNPDIIKMHLPSDYRDCEYFMHRWVIPEYFYKVHDPMHTRYREEFIKFAKENGYSVLEPRDKGMQNAERTEGIAHPVITHMCLAVIDFYEMQHRFDYKSSEEAYNIGG